MGQLISQDRLLQKQIENEAKKELYRLYQYSAGFSEPLPPTPEEREHMEEGLIEL